MVRAVRRNRHGASSYASNADIGATLTPLAAQTPALAPDTTRKLMPLRLIAPYSALQSATPALAMHTGRMRSAPLGRLEKEEVIVNGGGVEVGTFNRRGGYSAMTVDPVGDCAFWHTQQYIAAPGAFDWRPRIADFEFINCR
ncbi:MAG TPA: hypothetical protein VFS02_07545 [Telluria sp.]|nr:hypothetical protein [Telluria sp.]